MTKRTKRNRKRSRSKRRRIRGGTLLPSFISDIGRSAAYQFGNTMNELRGYYPNVNPSPLIQPNMI